MKLKNIALGAASAIALIAPMGVGSVAFAAPNTDDTVISSEVNADSASQAGVSAEQATQAELDLTTAQANEAAQLADVSEQESSAGEDAGVSSRAVVSTFGNVAFKLAKSYKPSSQGSVDRAFSVTFDGPAPSINNRYYGFDTNYYGPKVTVSAKNAGVKSANVVKPGVYTYPSSLTPAASNSYALTLSQYATPGKYQLAVPVQRSTYNGSSTTRTVKTKTQTFEVHANTKLSKQRTGWSASGRSGGTISMRVTAPDYQAGAKVTAYYKAPGKKKYKKVATSKLKSGSYNSQAKFNISKKYKVRAGGRLYVKVGAVSYASSYKSASGKMKKS